MGILRSIESSLERVVEGSFGRLFRASVQPVELARKLAKELEEGKVVSVTQTYAPNEYTVYLSRKDRERFAEYEASLRSELASYLAEQARRSGYTLPTRPRVRFETSTQLAVGIFGISTAVVQEEASAAYERRLEGDPPAVAAPPPAPSVQVVPAAPDEFEGPLGELISLPTQPAAVLPLGPIDAVPGLDIVPELEPVEPVEEAFAEEPAEAAPAPLHAVPEPLQVAPEPVVAEPEPEPAPVVAEVAAELDDPAEPEPDAPAPVSSDDEVSEPFDVEAYDAGPVAVTPRPLPPVVALPPPAVPLPGNVTPIRGLPSVTEVVPSPLRIGQLANEEIALVQDGRRYPIDQPVVVLGRAPGCDVTLDDRNVSRRHAEVRRRGPVVVLVDLESTNGTIVNGRRIREHPLADGDHITLGNSRLTFERRTH